MSTFLGITLGAWINIALNTAEIVFVVLILRVTVHHVKRSREWADRDKEQREKFLNLVDEFDQLNKDLKARREEFEAWSVQPWMKEIGRDE